MVCSATLFARLEAEAARLASPDSEAVAPLIADCCAIKARIVSDDEREAGPRRVLNFGHSVGHAIESVTAYRRFRHGEAVAWGMVAAAQIAVARGLLAGPDQRALTSLVMRLGPLPQIADLQVPQIVEAMRHDKKIVEGRLHFVLPSGIGTAVMADDVSEAEVATALSQVGFGGAAGGRPPLRT